jgi:hypothetical protein
MIGKKDTFVKGIVMAQFLNTQAAFTEIENIVNRAESKLVLIAGDIRITRALLQKLYVASEHRGIDITLVCRKNCIRPEELAALNQITRLEIFDLPDLHANCIYNEKAMVITSLNLYDYSQTNNRDMGIQITYEKDPAAFISAFNETEYMMQLATLVKANMVLAKVNRQPASNSDVSFFDIQGGLKRSFPTFAKILTHR